MEVHYIGAKWCKACHTVKPRAKEVTEKAKISFIEHDYDEMTEKEQEHLIKLPTIQVKSNGVLETTFTTITAADQLEIYLQKKLSMYEDF
jgi:thiol-disulfide isomerase/thioredoxin